MGFPLAHPAASLCLRRWCPRYFDLSSLVIGSLTPDLAASIDDWEYFSHTLLGSFIFCLPVGLVTLWIFHKVRTAIVSSLPNPHRDALLPLCTNPPNFRALAVVPSLLIGTWLHIVWDSFTHEHSWLVHKIPLLSFSFAGVHLTQILWLLTSVLGISILVVRYLELLHRAASPGFEFTRAERSAYWRWFGFLLLPFLGAIPLTFHDPDYSPRNLVQFVAMYYEACAYVTVALIGFMLKSRMSVVAQERRPESPQ